LVYQDAPINVEPTGVGGLGAGAAGGGILHPEPGPAPIAAGPYAHDARGDGLLAEPMPHPAIGLGEMHIGIRGPDAARPAPAKPIEEVEESDEEEESEAVEESDEEEESGELEPLFGKRDPRTGQLPLPRHPTNQELINLVQTYDYPTRDIDLAKTFLLNKARQYGFKDAEPIEASKYLFCLHEEITDIASDKTIAQKLGFALPKDSHAAIVHLANKYNKTKPGSLPLPRELLDFSKNRPALQVFFANLKQPDPSPKEAEKKEASARGKATHPSPAPMILSAAPGGFTGGPSVGGAFPSSDPMPFTRDEPRLKESAAPIGSFAGPIEPKAKEEADAKRAEELGYSKDLRRIDPEITPSKFLDTLGIQAMAAARKDYKALKSFAPYNVDMDVVLLQKANEEGPELMNYFFDKALENKCWILIYFILSKYKKTLSTDFLERALLEACSAGISPVVEKLTSGRFIVRDPAILSCASQIVKDALRSIPMDSLMYSNYSEIAKLVKAVKISHSPSLKMGY